MVFFVSTGNLYAENRDAEPDLETITSFIGLMQSYLDVAEKWVEMVSDKETAIYLVAERTTEIYEQKGDKAKAVPRLREILSKYKDNRAVRNALHFKIAEIYKEAGQHEKALDELKTILEAEDK